MWIRAVFGAVLLVLINFVAGDAFAQRDRDRDRDRDRGRSDWELLGSRTVGFRVDRDIIEVGRARAASRGLLWRCGRTTSTSWTSRSCS